MRWPFISRTREARTAAAARANLEARGAVFMQQMPEPGTNPRGMLMEFLEVWLQWVDRGAPEGAPFYRGTGLCGSTVPGIWKDSRYNAHDRDQMRKFMRSIWRGQGLDETYPFNHGVAGDMRREERSHQTFANRHRQQWAFATLMDLKEGRL